MAGRVPKGEADMTAVGKLLVFLNLVFSLVVGAFAVMTYQARTHLTDKYNKVAVQYAVAQGTAQAYQKRAEDLAKEKQAYNDKLREAGAALLQLKGDGDDAAKTTLAAIKQYQAELKELQNQIGAKQKELDEANKQVVALKAETTVGTQDVKVNADNYRKTVVQLNETLDQKRLLVVELNGTRDQKVAAEIDRDALKKKNEQMFAQLVSLEKENAAIKAERLLGGEGRRMAKRGVGSPPPSNLEGRITRVANRNLVKISVGSDNGLSMDNVLQVYRLGPAPKYLGKIRIVSLGASEAVGQAEGRMTGQMQEGDRVGASIVGGR